MPELTQEDVERIREFSQKATPAEWRYDGQHPEITTPSTKADQYWLIISECRSAPDQTCEMDEFGHQFDNNFALIAELRNHADALLAMAERGLKLETFFREMEDRNKRVEQDGIGVVACRGCKLWTLCQVNEVCFCYLITKANTPQQEADNVDK